MSGTGKVAVGFVIWGLIIALFGFALTYVALAPGNYSGREVSFEANMGWIIDVETSSPVRLQAANASYFGLVQGETNLYSVPQEPFLGYPKDRYFFLEAEEVEGKWEVVDGEETTFVLTSKEDFTVRKYPSDVHANKTRNGAITTCLLIYLLTIFVALIATI